MKKTFKKTFFIGLIFLSLASFSDRHVRADSWNFHDSSHDLASAIENAGLKKDIIKPAQGILKYPYLVPAGPYDQLFDWDMYFMGVALSYDGVSTPVEDSVKDFLEFVDETANDRGYAPREIATDRPWALPEQCKPFMAQAAVRASLTAETAERSGTAGSWDWVKDFYPKLQLMVEYWENTRRAPDGLFVWYNGVESGVDNNPAVSDRPALATEGVDLQVYLYREYLALALIGEKLHDEASANLYRGKASALKDLILKKMWSQKDGFFYNIDSRTGLQIPIKTWVGFLPLWAKIPDADQARVLIETHLLASAEFWSANGVRTLSATDVLYAPTDGYWRGPIWVISNYLTLHGLLNYGYKDSAIELAQKTTDLLLADFQKTGGMNECYDPETGEPTAGGNFVSWNLLSEHILDEARFGADPTHF